MSGGPRDVRAGRRWRLPGGEQVLVNALDGDQVDGTLIQAETFAVWVKKREALLGATLMAPVFRVTIQGPKHDRAWRVIEHAGTIVHGATEAAGSVYYVDIAAADTEAALHAVRDACSVDPRFDLDTIRLAHQARSGEVSRR